MGQTTMIDKTSGEGLGHAGGTGPQEYEGWSHGRLLRTWGHYFMYGRTSGDHVGSGAGGPVMVDAEQMAYEYVCGLNWIRPWWFAGPDMTAEQSSRYRRSFLKAQAALIHCEARGKESSTFDIRETGSERPLMDILEEHHWEWLYWTPESRIAAELVAWFTPVLALRAERFPFWLAGNIA